MQLRVWCNGKTPTKKSLRNRRLWCFKEYANDQGQDLSVYVNVWPLRRGDARVECMCARAQIALAYHHFTGASKPWSKFRPKNPRNLAWYVAVSRDLTDAAPLRALFPDVDDHLAVLRPLVNKK